MKLTRQQAIRAKCTDCIVDPVDVGTPLKQIENCISTDCALHEYRPITTAAKAAIKAEYVESLSDSEKEKYFEAQSLAKETMFKNLGKS